MHKRLHNHSSANVLPAYERLPAESMVNTEISSVNAKTRRRKGFLPIEPGKLSTNILTRWLEEKFCCPPDFEGHCEIPVDK